MTLTVLGMTGIGSFANAAAPQAGDLIKMDGLSAVYFLGNDGKRYVFPSESVFFSWHNDFSGVVTISASELASYPLGANVVVRPGTKLVKITTDPSVYAVEANGVLRKISSEADAIAIFGANWAKRVIDVSDAFFTNYTIGTALANGQIPAGTLVKNAGSGAVYLYDGANYRSIANEAAFNANRFNFANVITISNTITASGNAVTGAESLNYDAQVGGTGPIVTGSGLTASLSAATPAGASVPKNGARIPMAKVNLTAANDGAVTINSITVKRIGLSAYTNIDKVWAEQNGTIVASKKSMNSNDESILTFSPALTVGAGQTVTLDLIASFPSTNTGSGNIGLSIASASAVSATAAAISGSFPINGNLMSPTDYSVTEVLLDEGGAAVNVNVGDENVQLGKFTVNFASNTRDIVLKSAMFKNSGDEDLAKVIMNAYLENNGKKVATAAISGKYITFTFSNGGLTMLKDDGDQIFAIKGDVIAKENTATSNNVVLSLNKIEDFNGNELTNGFGVKVQDASLVQVANLTIKSGVVSVSKKSTSPSDVTVIKGTKAVVALLANVKADEAIVADGLRINTDFSNVDAFENVKVYVNGALLDSYDPITAAATTTLSSTLSLNKGDNEIKVTVDVKSNATTTSAVFKASLNKSSHLLDTPEYVLSQNAVAEGDITGTATGASITVSGAALSAIRSDGYSDKNVVIGTSDISLGKFTVKATNDTVKITQIDIASTTNNTVLASSIYDMKLYMDGVQVGSTKDFGTTGATFSSLSISVADNQTKTIELKGSIDTAATGSIKMLSTFTAEDSRGKTVSVSGTPVTAKFTVVGAGTLGITKDGDSPVSAILASKPSVEQSVAQFKLVATNDSANVTELTVVNASTTGTSTITTTDPRISSYKLYVEGNSTAIDTVTPFNGEAKFVINNNAIVVPADGSKKLTIKAVLNNIDNDESATNAYLKLQVNSVKFKSSNSDLTYTTGLSVVANEFRIRKTVPTVALLALPNTTLTSGNSVVAKFTVTADSNADVRVSRIALDYTKTASVTLATTSNAIKVNGVAKAVTSTTSATQIFVDFGTTTPEIVAAGTSKTFEVILVTTVTGSNRESVSTSIAEAAYAAGTLLTPAFTSLTWTDSASNTDANNYWFNSYRVNGLPSDTQTMSIN